MKQKYFWQVSKSLKKNPQFQKTKSITKSNKSYSITETSV